MLPIGMNQSRRDLKKEYATLPTVLEGMVKQLLEACYQRGFTAAKLAKKMKCRKGLAEEILQGKHLLNLRTIHRVAEALDLNFEVLFYPKPDKPFTRRPQGKLRKGKPTRALREKVEKEKVKRLRNNMNGRLTKKEMIEAFEVGGDEWTRVVRALMKDGLVGKTGRGRGTRYQLL